MRLLHARTPVDIATIALWLGHETLETTNKYLHADMELKRRALDRTAPPTPSPAATGHPTRYSRSLRASDRHKNMSSSATPDPRRPTRPPRPRAT